MSPSRTAIIYRVAYRRTNWRKDVWKNKLFNSELAARKYAANLLAPPTDDTPEKFRKLLPVTIRMSHGMTTWSALPDLDEASSDYNDTAQRESYRQQYAKAHDGELPTEAELDYWIELLQEEEE